MAKYIGLITDSAHSAEYLRNYLKINAPSVFAGVLVNWLEGEFTPHIRDENVVAVKMINNNHFMNFVYAAFYKAAIQLSHVHKIKGMNGIEGDIEYPLLNFNGDEKWAMSTGLPSEELKLLGYGYVEMDSNGLAINRNPQKTWTDLIFNRYERYNKKIVKIISGFRAHTINIRVAMKVTDEERIKYG